MIHQESCLLYDKIAYATTFDVSRNDEEGRKLAKILGQDKTILFQSNHGVASVGPTVAHCLYHLTFLERACMYQVGH